MTVDDLMVPPKLKFSLPSFWNPRTMSSTGAFGISIYSDEDQEIYSWNNTFVLSLNGNTVTSGITEGPAVKMSTAATP